MSLLTKSRCRKVVKTISMSAFADNMSCSELVLKFHSLWFYTIYVANTLGSTCRHVSARHLLLSSLADAISLINAQSIASDTGSLSEITEHTSRIQGSYRTNYKMLHYNGSLNWMFLYVISFTRNNNLISWLLFLGSTVFMISSYMKHTGQKK